MLRFILGGSGSGKSEYIKNILCESQEKQLMLLVPDQSSFDTEKGLLQKLGPSAMHKIKVFGFSRLCDFVLSQSGGPFPDPLEEPDRALIMSIALDEVSDSLKLFGNKKLGESFINTMLDAVSEYEKCAVSPDNLRFAAAKVSDKSLKYKLTDTALIYDAYNAVLSDRYTEPLKRLEIVSEIIKTENPFAGYTIAIDSFSTFTSVEFAILSVLMRDCADMYISLTLEHSGEDARGLFFTTNRTYRTLRRAAADNGIKIAANIVLSENFRAESLELKFLEKNIFRSEAEVFDDKCEAVRIYFADTVYSECEYAASEIKRLIISQGYYYNDFAILMRNAQSYEVILQNALKKYDLRYFDDRRESVADKPLIKLIFYIFDAVNNGLDPESVLQILKTGLLPFTIEEIAEFENYIYCWSVDSNDICHPFVNNPRGFVSNFTQQDTERLEIIERVRSGTVGPLLNFREKSREANADQITKSLYDLLLKLKADCRLTEICENYSQLGQFRAAEEYTRLWDCLMNSLDKIIMIAGERKMSLKRYAHLLSMQLARADIGFIPQGQDLITVGSADRIRLNDKKVVFILGAVEGEFPKIPEEYGIFSDNERRRLLDLGLDLDYCCEDMIKQENFLVYTALTCASEKLYISRYSQNLSGESFAPSSIIYQICKIFPHIEIDTLPADLDVQRKLLSERSAFELCSQRFNSRDALSAQLKEYFSGIETYSKRLNAMNRVSGQKQTDIKDRNAVRKLFGRDLNISATQIEKFHNCRFSYLCNYGFKIRERKKFSVDSLEYGSFIHYILQRFFSENQSSGYKGITKESAALIINRYIDDYISGAMEDMAKKSDRFAYLLYRIKETASALVVHIACELEQSRFKPEFYEYKIGQEGSAPYTLILDDGISINISGSIDRVDIMDTDNKKYVRIIDYKTNSKKFSLYDILHGLNLQMLLYLSAVCRSNDFTPAGILYMPAISPVINSDGDDPVKIENEIDKALTMNGLLINKTEVLTGMEEKLEGKYIPVTSKNFGKNGSLITEKQFIQIFTYLDTKIVSMAEEIYGGNFSPVPVKGGADGCSWCPYGDVCEFAEGKPQNNIFSMKNDEVFEIIEKEIGGDN